MSKRHKKLKKKTAFIIIAILAVLIIAIVVTIILLGNNKETNVTKTKSKTKNNESESISIVDTSTTSRPYAVMINNDVDRTNMAGIQDAYIIYDIIEEGGISRFMALFLDTDTERIGNVRSTRHYYIDYVLENDAILCHNGQSPQAKADFNLIDRIEIEKSKTGIRDNTLTYTHSWNNLFTSIELIENGLGSIRTERNNDLLLEYSSKSINLTEINGSIEANNVSITFSSSNKPSYEYDSENKVYKRFMNGNALIDNNINEQFTVKNIITYQIENYTLTDSEGKGRQGLYNTGSGTGYYISEGVAVPITWEKESRSSQTVYKYLNGEEIKVNDGNTIIELQPKDQSLKIS